MGTGSTKQILHNVKATGGVDGERVRISYRGNPRIWAKESLKGEVEVDVVLRVCEKNGGERVDIFSKKIFTVFYHNFCSLFLLAPSIFVISVQCCTEPGHDLASHSLA